MNVRSKWTCLSVKKYQSNTWDEKGRNMTHGFLYAYEFQVVSSGSDENKKFFASTPIGNMNFSAVRDDLYEPGKLYYFDSAEAD